LVSVHFIQQLAPLLTKPLFTKPLFTKPLFAKPLFAQSAVCPIRCLPNSLIAHAAVCQRHPRCSNCLRVSWHTVACSKTLIDASNSSMSSAQSQPGPIALGRSRWADRAGLIVICRLPVFIKALATVPSASMTWRTRQRTSRRFVLASRLSLVSAENHYLMRFPGGQDACPGAGKPARLGLYHNPGSDDGHVIGDVQSCW